MDEVEANYRAVMGGNDPEAAAHAARDLGARLADRGRLDEAELVLQFAADSDFPEAGLTAERYLGMVRLDLGRSHDAERTLRRVMAAGHPFESGAAAVTLGGLLQRAGRFDDAEAALRTAMNVGDPGVVGVAAGNLATLVRERGDGPEAVEAAYRDAMDTADPKTRSIALTNLAAFMVEQGRPGEAERHLRDAVADDHPEVAPVAAGRLGHILMESDRRDEAVAFLRRALNSDEPAVVRSAASNLGIVSRDLDRPGEAEDAFRVAADLGDLGSTMELAKLLERRGAVDEAADRYQALATHGHHPLYIQVGTEGRNRLLGTPGAPSPGVEAVLADVDAVVAVLRRHGALFAYLDHQPSTMARRPGSDRGVAAWFASDRPIPHAPVVEAEIGPLVDRVEVLNRSPLETGLRIADTGRLILDEDRPARIAWLVDIRMVALDSTMFTAAGRARSHAVDLLTRTQPPPARPAEMARFVHAHHGQVVAVHRALAGAGRAGVTFDHGALVDLRDNFFAAVVGCTRIAHIVVAERDWERPETVRDVFDILVRHGTIDAFVADVLTDAEREMDHGGPGTVPDDAQVQACLDPTYMACVERFLYATGAAS